MILYCRLGRSQQLGQNHKICESFCSKTSRLRSGGEDNHYHVEESATRVVHAGTIELCGKHPGTNASTPFSRSQKSGSDNET